MMRCGHLFNGISGFGLAAHWMGWENIMHCEIDPFCNKVMNKHFPNSYEHTDIRTTDFTIWRGKLDIITGGFPCQPFSVAGARKGTEDDRHLWPQMLRAVREIQPRWVIGENVPGLLNWKGGLVLNEIKVDMETSGFEFFPPLVLPACGKDAMHRRNRLWIIAHNAGQYLQKQEMVFPARSISEFREPAERLPNSLWRFDRKTYLSDMVGKIHGLSDWVDRSKALGNAIVPQVAFEIFKAIEQYEGNSDTI